MQRAVESLVAVLDQYATELPNGVPFCYLEDGEANERPLTYQKFKANARAIGGFLQSKGLQGKVVLLLFPQGLEYLIALFGCFYAGAIAVPAYPPRNNRNLKRLLLIMENCGAEHILADRDGINHILRMKRDFSDYRLYPYEEALEADLQRQERSVTPDDIAYLQYTSGSTQVPKGVVVTHRNLVENIKGLKETYYPYELKAMVSWIPMYHDMGLLSMLTTFTLKEVCCYFMSPAHFVQRPARWLQAISKYEAQYTVGPNFAYDLCCEKVSEADLQGVDLRCLKSMTNGSEPVRLSTIMEFYEKFAPFNLSFLAFCPGYGLAEATLGVSVLGAAENIRVVSKEAFPRTSRPLTVEDIPLEDADDYWVGCGHVVQNADVQIVDTASGQAVEDGEEGEVWVHHDGFVSQGYWNNKEASEQTFGNQLPDKAGKRYLRTGDLGFKLDGQLFITGRIKDMVIIRGQNFYPQDIELAAAQAHEALENNACAAFTLEEENRERLVLVQEVKRTKWRQADPDAVVLAIRQRLAEEFEISPYRIALIRPMSLPKTSSGKVQRYAAKAQLQKGELRILQHWKAQDSRPEPELNTIEGNSISPALIIAWLRQNIAEKTEMKQEEIDPLASIKDYPLESVDAIFLSNELSEWLGLTLTPDTFWAFDTIEELADFLHRKYQEAQS